MPAQIQSDLLSFIVSNYLFGDTERTPGETDSLMAQGIIDSTGILELVEYLESHFGISVGEEETIPQNLDTIANLTRFVASKTASDELSA